MGTYPWITFRLDLSELSTDTWMLLGEARSKCEHIAGVPLKPSVAERLHRLYLAKGVHATTAIEGNTLSEHDAELLLEGKLDVPRSKEYLKREMENIVGACEKILDACLAGNAFELSVDWICRLNGQVLAGLDVEDHVTPGKLRQVSVGVMNYRGPDWQDVPGLLDRMCRWLSGPEFQRDGDWSLPVALLRAVAAHLYLAWIHPFGDGNGRTARLVEYALLVSAGVPSPAGHLLSNHYNDTRSEYYRQLSYASQSGGDVTRFVAYAVRGFVDGLHAQLGVIREQQRLLAWADYVRERFTGRPSETTRRRRELVVTLGPLGVVSKDEIPTLTKRLGGYYRAKSDKTLARDLNEVVSLGLVDREVNGYRARVELIDAFLPFRGGMIEPS